MRMCCSKGYCKWLQSCVIKGTEEKLGAEIKNLSTQFKEVHETLEKVADSTKKTATKCSFQEVRMMHGFQGYSPEATLRQVTNAYEEWNVERSETYLLAITHAEFIKYGNSRGGRIEPDDEIWR